MGIKSFAIKIAANFTARRVYAQHKNAVAIQNRLLLKFVRKAANTEFGKAHNFNSIQAYNDFNKNVQIYNYEQLINYIERITNGHENVLWPGKPMYFCKSSGTTAGTKYIPVTHEQIKEMIAAARNSLLLYVAQTGQTDFFDHKMIFLQGSPELDMHGAIPTGRLSGIVYHHVPPFLRGSRMPSYDINCLTDWEEKVEAIAYETLNQKMSLISGIPPWVVMYFEKLKEITGKEYIKDIFPEFKMFAYGGVNYEPYRAKIEGLIGFKIPSVETYPASEGFIAYQDLQPLDKVQNDINSNSYNNDNQLNKQVELLLNINGGIFYEFVKAGEINSPNPTRISLADVELGVNYALLLTTNAGLWAYNLGDTIKFTSLAPYRIVVTGRVKHFISAFGEHVISEEVDLAMLNAMRQLNTRVTEFTVAPLVNPKEGEPSYHEWFVEFSQPPADLSTFAELMDQVLQQHNPYYKDLRQGHILQRLKVRTLKPGSFVEYMKAEGKLGGQNKVPRLTNDRKIAEGLERFVA